MIILLHILLRCGLGYYLAYTFCVLVCFAIVQVHHFFFYVNIRNVWIMSILWGSHNVFILFKFCKYWLKLHIGDNSLHFAVLMYCPITYKTRYSMLYFMYFQNVLCFWFPLNVPESIVAKIPKCSPNFHLWCFFNFIVAIPVVSS